MKLRFLELRGDSMEQQRILLKEIGLTEYETKSFLTLLTIGVATAEQISEVAQIPLPRVYDTLTQLQKKGFVLINKGRPKKFKANSPKKAFKLFIEGKKKEHNSEIEYLKETVKKLEASLSSIKSSSIKDETLDIWSMEKRKNMKEILNEQMEMSKKEILIFSGDMSWLEESSKIMKSVIKRGVKIKAIMHEPESEQTKKNIKLAKRIGIKVKTNYTGLMRGHVIDNKIVSLAIKQTNEGLNPPGVGMPGFDDVHRYELITSSNPVLVKTFTENFNFWWKKLN